MRLLLLVGVGLVAVGCNQQDRDCLSKVGKRLVEQMEDAAGTSPDPVASGIQAVRGSVGGGHLDSRVVLRLRWERDLAGATIRVRATGPATVALEGTLRDEGQRGRALEVARATSGVEQVEDKMQVK